MPNCIYRGCDQHRVPLSSISYFALPPNPGRRQLWVERCGHRWDPDRWLRQRGHCCERHFDEVHIRRQFYRTTLRHDALPVQWQPEALEAVAEAAGQQVAKAKPRLRKLLIVAPPKPAAEQEVRLQGEEVLDYDDGYLMSDVEQLSDSLETAMNKELQADDAEPEPEQQPSEPEPEIVEEIEFYDEHLEVYDEYIEVQQEQEVEQQQIQREQLVEIYDPVEMELVSVSEAIVTQPTRPMHLAEEEKGANAADSTDQMRCDTTTSGRETVPEPEPEPVPQQAPQRVSPEHQPAYPCVKALDRRQLKRKRLQAKIRRKQQKMRARQVIRRRQAQKTPVPDDRPVVAAAQPEPVPASAAASANVAHLPPIALEDAEDTYFALSLVGFLKRLQPQQRAMAKMNVIRYLTEMAFSGGEARL